MIKMFTENRKVKHDYEIVEKFEAGIELLGVEVKSIRSSNVNLRGSYISIRNGQAFLREAYIARYRKDPSADYDTYRERRLLLNKREILNLLQKTKEKGYTIVPLNIHASSGLIKLEIALGKGRRLYDKRSVKKAKDIQRDIDRAVAKN